MRRRSGGGIGRKRGERARGAREREVEEVEQGGEK